MRRRPDHSVKNPVPTRHNAGQNAIISRGGQAGGRRARLSNDQLQRCYMPPEVWHEPHGEESGYEIIVQKPGKNFKHVLTPEDVRQRLASFPEEMLAGLEVVQFSEMTRKKRRVPCYGMQWGAAIYLYPIETSRIEIFTDPPIPSQQVEANMFGARWEQAQDGYWQLIWTEEAIRDFYLNNVLIHELGHLLDQRNTTFRDRERFAEWFAVEHGYKPARRAALAAGALKKMVVKRHHK